MFSWYQRLKILDDDRPGSDGAQLWFGFADGLDSCPEPHYRARVPEPFGGGARWVTLDLALASRPADTGGDSRGCDAGSVQAVVDYRYEFRSGTAELGRDALDPAGGGVLRFVSGRASLDLVLVGDASLEGPEDLTLALVGGAGAVALFEIVIEDAALAAESVSASTATAVRVGRVLAAEVSDVLADRFSLRGLVGLLSRRVARAVVVPPWWCSRQGPYSVVVAAPAGVVCGRGRHAGAAAPGVAARRRAASRRSLRPRPSRPSWRFLLPCLCWRWASCRGSACRSAPVVGRARRVALPGRPGAVAGSGEHRRRPGPAAGVDLLGPQLLRCRRKMSRPRRGG